jgi:hypothetical protein
MQQHGASSSKRKIDTAPPEAKNSSEPRAKADACRGAEFDAGPDGSADQVIAP